MGIGRVIMSAKAEGMARIQPSCLGMKVIVFSPYIDDWVVHSF